MAFDPFALDDSAEEGFQGVITDITYAAGKYDFQATITVKHDEPRKRNDGTLSYERPVFIKVGGADQGYIATNDGKEFDNTNGNSPKGNSAWGRFIKRVVELNGGTAPADLVGLWARWELEGAGKAYSFEDKATGEKKQGESKGYWIPVEIRTDGTSSNGAAKADFDLQSLRDAGMTDDIEGELCIAARASDIPGDFLARAVAVEGVAGNTAISAALANPSFYETLRAR